MSHQVLEQVLEQARLPLTHMPHPGQGVLVFLMTAWLLMASICGAGGGSGGTIHNACCLPCT
jgi:hypothetical protein